MASATGFFGSCFWRRQGRQDRDQDRWTWGPPIRVVDQPMKGGGWVATFEDITEWQRAQEQISHMARHDALTNLPNRTLFRESSNRRCGRSSAATSSRRSPRPRPFQGINDRSAIRSATRCSSEVAARLAPCVGPSDTVARLGGDEFAIVQFCNGCDPSAVSALASH